MFWIYLNMAMAVAGTIVFIILICVNQALYDHIKERIVPLPEESKWSPAWFTNPFLHFLIIMPISMATGPIMNIANGLWSVVHTRTNADTINFEIRLEKR